MSENPKISESAEQSSTEKARMALSNKQELMKDMNSIKENQAHAISMTTALSRVKISNSLNDDNFPVWAKQIKGNLKSLYLDHLLDPEANNHTTVMDHINARCVFEFILGRMDETNSQIFRALYEEEVAKHETCEPAILWILITNHHQCEKKASIFQIHTKIDKLKQKIHTSITDRVDTFMWLKAELVSRGESPDDKMLARRLLNLLHEKHYDEVRHIIRNVVPLK